MGEKKNQQDPFADYMWMENMDEYDRQVEEEIFEEEEFIRACIEQLLKEEEDERETLTAPEIIAQQQLQNLEGTDSAQNGTHQSSYRNGFQASSPHSNGYTNDYGNHDYSVVVSPGGKFSNSCEWFIVLVSVGRNTQRLSKWCKKIC